MKLALHVHENQQSHQHPHNSSFQMSSHSTVTFHGRCTPGYNPHTLTLVIFIFLVITKRCSRHGCTVIHVKFQGLWVLLGFFCRSFATGTPPKSGFPTGIVHVFCITATMQPLWNFAGTHVILTDTAAHDQRILFIVTSWKIQVTHVILKTPC